jgi:KUP system potassium uptake protein
MNRRNLRHFIVTEDGEKHALPPIEVQPSTGVDVEVDTLGEETYYYLERIGSDAEEEKQELVRIDTCAVFHKLGSGKGVPHSFVGE